ncbi:MAG TPA: hypothetical protein VKP12_18040 [Kiloniellaceae bacterium]|nr:hypothetical protein [Kiloniellaceae bacterium]
MVRGSAAVLRAFCLAAAAASIFVGSALADSPSDSHPPDSRKAGMAADALRLLNEADQHRAQQPGSQDAFLAPTPAESLSDAALVSAVRTGAVPPRGVDVRDDPVAPPELDPYFEGTFKLIHHDYVGSRLVTYDRGVYAVPRREAYVGTFSYFAQPTETDVAFIWPKGSFVVVGKKLTPDGEAETGIYIAEEATAGFALNFVKATPDYLADFERRHARATEAYRRQQAAEAAGSGFDFGQVLALGLGAAMISGADLPGVDKMQLGQAFVSDVLGEGDGTALMSALTSTGTGAGGTGSLFSGGMSFEAPGLDSLLASLAQQAGGAPAAAPGGAAAPVSAPSPAPAAATASGGAATTETYSFSCPHGGSYSIPVSYRKAACGAAMKNFARVYSCNLIDDFASAGERCRQACGQVQCAEQ